LVGLLATADRGGRAALYRSLGLRLTYEKKQPGTKRYRNASRTAST